MFYFYYSAFDAHVAQLNIQMSIWTKNALITFVGGIVHDHWTCFVDSINNF